MQYAVIQISNGTATVVAEHINSLDTAITNYHTTAAALSNAPDVNLAAVMIVDDQLRLVNGKHEVIDHRLNANT